MKKAQSPYNQRNQFSNFHFEDDRNNKTKQQSGSYSALKNIKAAVKKVFTVLLFRRKVNSKAAASVIDPRRNSNRIRGVSSSTDRSSGSTDTKNSSKFKSSGSYGSSTTLSGIIETKYFSYEEISKATEKFSQANIIGEGGFGIVYRGRLGDGSLVAVKRARKTGSDKLLQLEFKNEILTLSMIEHLNLVRLYGYLEHGDERIILVEYVGNGTLREHLDGTRGNGLEIAERLDIAIDVAHAITYLHMYTDPPIIHRDIKSLNILITEKLRAKVADFGFARLSADSDATHISTQVKGTAGYLDPEYLKTYQLTEKSDVYSFGVLLVELMTGRRPIEPNKPHNERLTTRWAFQTLKRGEAVLVMDPRLRRNAASTMAMEKILRLAHECLAPLRQSRPSMKKCGEVLWGIRKEYRQVAFPPPPTSHYSANFPVRDPKMTRQQTFGIEDDDNYKFVSA
ncbi:PREDICTED: calmodulin-binding receptor-like cytoplasmic kinase 2 [Fragaria vesca subsp. vesca]|uniref:calmodulin-binding receptor-like cytoplasmic kinase 2 n=1 Tax=Fragaria vesca subsp. vesca TaxID=101020 RepID=UPI0002C334B4|nr:PREDICTED: calmodulin-binding receptor-like cytoplasmic kinase 2 [Fragaria vesca subsp. vesca]XP_011460915.1 PREDICTED: calmodulin-binding receptor-like cytoplasmic kinase 2 [Fragaria vesca subsp. vesca]